MPHSPSLCLADNIHFQLGLCMSDELNCVGDVGCTAFLEAKLFHRFPCYSQMSAVEFQHLGQSREAENVPGIENSLTASPWTDIRGGLSCTS